MEFFSQYSWAVILAIAAAAIGLNVYSGWRRRKALEALALSAGLPLLAEGPSLESLEATGLEIFRLGRSRKASNLIQISSSSGELRFFDYRYTTGSGKHSSTHNFTLALIECSRCQVPDFDLKPENFMHKIGEAIGFKDVDLPAFPLFSDKYRLTGSEEAALHMFFTPERAAWFERNLGLRVQGSRGFLVLFKREGLMPVDAWQGFIEEVKAFAAEVLR
ncbi:MAG TPA: hypothetical protein DCS63_04200 [Elusimicrobia bacterium]|nr:hypothetical protein [Elusimicrobiota bacterium]